MKNNYTSIVSLTFIIGILGFTFFTMMPQWIEDDVSLSEFSTKRALEQVKNISQKAHYVGSENHDFVASYLENELQSIGLETSIQEGFSFSANGTLTKCKNIIARIKGTNSKKALLLLSHYDSAPHSASHGASDAGSGVATILESIRAFTYNKKHSKNDIIILFTDAEELDLNGASLFVTQHHWAKDVGLVLNFEARGSSGPSYMLMETNAGNAGLAKEFAAANVKFPVSNSLMYSVYKMLPNDTDLTIFRKNGNIQGFNFAFIDGHYNYHTTQDDINHLNKNSVAHQGEYLMPLLDYFSNANLHLTKSTQDDVYFSVPFGFISYPFDWVLPMVIIAFGLLLFIVIIGTIKRILTLEDIIKGFIPFFGSLLCSGLVAFLGWKALLLIYPEYNDLLNGFTYNGHDYITAFTLLTLSICFIFYQLSHTKRETENHYVAPLFIWIIINGFLAYYLEGAGFLILPAYSGIFLLGYYVITQKFSWFPNVIFSIPTLLLIVPFIELFPIGLGLKTLFVSALLTVFAFGLLLPVFGAFNRKEIIAAALLILSIGFFAKANYESGYESGKAKSNSLVYILDADTNKAIWATYDINLDHWTKTYLGENPKNAQDLNDIPLKSKYNSKFTFSADAPMKDIPKPTIEFLKDSVIGTNRYLKIRITPNRKVNRYDLFANETLIIQNLKANGLTLLGQKGSQFNREGKKLLSYYVVDNIPLEIQFNVPAASIFDLELWESSFDLMSNPLFFMQKRADWMMPTPFVLNDAIIIKEKIKITSKRIVQKPIEPKIPTDSLAIPIDSIKTP